MSTSKRKNATKKEEQPQQTSSEDIEEIIQRITLKHPRSPYSLYISEMYEKENKDELILNLMEVNKKYSRIWSKLTSTAKSKYFEISAQERAQYKRDLLTVKNELFRGCVFSYQSPYQIFIEEMLRLALENGRDLDEAKISSKEEWSEMTNEEKNKWRQKKKENDSWLDQARKNTARANAYSVFMEKRKSVYKERGETLTFKQLSEEWRKITDKDKRKYAVLAEEINREKMKYRKLYELCHGIKPKRPCGAYKIFLQEKAKEGKFKGKNALKEGKKLWDKLPTKKKDEYLKKSHKIHLIYIYKTILYKQSVKKLAPTQSLSAFNFYLADMKGKGVPNGENYITYYREQWKSLDEKSKAIYVAKEEKAKKEYLKTKEEFSNRVYDMPKKQVSSYSCYVRDEISKMVQNGKKVALLRRMCDISAQWNNLSKEEKAKYMKEAKEDQERYQRQMKEFKEFHYYTKEVKENVERSMKKKSVMTHSPSKLPTTPPQKSSKSRPKPSKKPKKSQTTAKKSRRK